MQSVTRKKQKFFRFISLIISPIFFISLFFSNPQPTFAASQPKSMSQSLIKTRQCAQVPNIKSLLFATPSVLISAGLPLHPQNMPDQEWLNLVKHAIKRTCVILSTPSNSSIHLSSVSENQNLSWAGNVAIGSQNSLSK